MADPKPPHTRYAFTLEARVSANPIGETPTGYRLDIAYETDGSRSYTRPLPYFDDWVLQNFETIFPLLVQDPLSGLGPASSAGRAALLNESEGATDPEKTASLDTLRNLTRDETKSQGQRHRALSDSEKRVVVRAIRNVRERTKNDAQPSPDLTTALGGWYGLEADLLSGNDWAIVRSDGVAEFAGRITLRSQDDDGGLIDLTVGGPVDFIGQLAPASTTPGGPRRPLPSPSEGFQTVLEAMESGKLPSAAVVLAATFNAAGRAEDWAPKRMKRQADGFWKYQMLTKSEFLATGRMLFSTSRFNPITHVELDFYQVRLQ